jgi:hypothetical protein
MYELGQLLQKADNVGTSINIGGLYVIVDVTPKASGSSCIYKLYRMHDGRGFFYTEGSLDHYFISL